MRTVGRSLRLSSYRAHVMSSADCLRELMTTSQKLEHMEITHLFIFLDF